MTDLAPLALLDGRLLDLAVSGPPDGVPLLYFHGTPGAAVAPRALERAVHARGGRFVVWSRPGYGSSTRQFGRRVLDTVADAEVVLDHLDAERCVVAGHSGGGPHALACAAQLSRARAALLVASVAPADAADLDFLGGMGEGNVEEFTAALDGERSLRHLLEAQAGELRMVAAADVTTAMASVLPDVDRAMLTDEHAEDVVAAFRKGLHASVDGWLDDDLALTTPWGVAPEEVRVPTALWHGSADLMVPPTHGAWLARRIPNVDAHLLENEGHLSVQRGEERLAQLLDPLLARA